MKIAQKFSEFKNDFDLKINKSGLEKRKVLNEAKDISNKKYLNEKDLYSLIHNFLLVTWPNWMLLMDFWFQMMK